MAPLGYFKLLCALLVIHTQEVLSGRTIIITQENSPVTFKPAHGGSVGIASLLQQTEAYRKGLVGEVLQSSFDNPEKARPRRRKFVPVSNGFVDAVVRAYNEHHDLVIRPDDVWIAIMTQFSFYVNGHAEKLRSSFVTFDGQLELVAKLFGDVGSADYVSMIEQFTHKIGKNLKDDTVREWVIADFSTTTNNDRIVSQAVLMGAMQKYFRFKAQIVCGIPKITIQGNRNDWVKIKKRVARLTQYGENCVKWSAMLDAILDQFVAVFDEPYNGTATEPQNLHFWQSIASHRWIGCGTQSLTGWITAFCVFNELGKWNVGGSMVDSAKGGTTWPAIDSDSIPPGYVAVPVIIDDLGTIYQAQLFAGHLAFSYRAAQRKSSKSRLDAGSCLRPQVVWAIALIGSRSQPNGTTVAKEYGEQAPVQSQL